MPAKKSGMQHETILFVENDLQTCALVRMLLESGDAPRVNFRSPCPAKPFKSADLVGKVRQTGDRNKTDCDDLPH